MNDIDILKKQIKDIQQRNEIVEKNKAWETSIERKILISLFTYVCIVIFFFTANLTKPFINAIVPTLGFIISTLSFGIIKKLWIKKQK